MIADATVRICLFDKECDEGRVHAPITGRQFDCPVFFRAESGHDARIYFAEELLPVSPGDEVTAQIKFLYSEDVAPFLRPGTRFRLWEGGFFAEGEVVIGGWGQ